MKPYSFGRIQRLYNSLIEHNVDPEIIQQIMAGGEHIANTAKPAIKAHWFSEAMHRMDTLLTKEQRMSIREGCACCLGGKRLQLSRQIARDHHTLDARIDAANATHYVFGHSVTRESDGSVLVRFFPEGSETYRCVCLHDIAEPVSETYCYCCMGHIRHHLQIALGVPAVGEVVETALTSGGQAGCIFRYRLKAAPTISQQD